MVGCASLGRKMREGLDITSHGKRITAVKWGSPAAVFKVAAAPFCLALSLLEHWATPGLPPWWPFLCPLQRSCTAFVQNSCAAGSGLQSHTWRQAWTKPAQITERVRAAVADQTPLRIRAGAPGIFMAVACTVMCWTRACCRHHQLRRAQRAGHHRPRGQHPGRTGGRTGRHGPVPALEPPHFSPAPRWAARWR